MKEFWEGLDFIQKFYFCIAIPSTSLLLLQTLLLIFNFSDEFDDIDFDMDGFTLFSVKGIISFFAVGSWSGLLFYDMMPTPLVIILSFIMGTLALVGIAFLMKYLMKLQSSGNLDYNNAKGKTGTVYLTVPKNNNGFGKINVLIQERLIELEAKTVENEDISTGSKVEVVEIIDNYAVVKKI